MAITTDNSGAILIGRRRKEGDPMVRVRLTSGTIIDGRHADAGDVVEVGTTFGKQLIHAGKAMPAGDEPEPPATRSEEVDDEPPAEKPKPTRGAGKKKDG